MLLENKTGIAVQLDLNQMTIELTNNDFEKLLKQKKMIELVILMSCHSGHAAKLLIDYKLANHVIYVLGEA